MGLLNSLMPVFCSAQPHRPMAGEVDYMLRVAVADMAAFDTFYKRLIAAVPLKNVTSRFAMERMKHTTAYPLIGRAFRDRRGTEADPEAP